MARQGEAFWIATPLPGEQSGGRHTSVILSCPAYNSRTGFPVIAALRRQRPSQYRVAVHPADFIPVAGQPALDTQRVIGLDQCSGVQAAALTAKHGDVMAGPVRAALALVARQFQIASPPYSLRGEIWRLRRSINGISEVVLVLNDHALNTQAMTQVLALPRGHPAEEAPLLMVGRRDLAARLGQLNRDEQERLDEILQSAFAGS